MNKTVATALFVATTAVAAPAFAQDTTEDWVNKTNAFGIGAGATLASGPGLSLRFYPVEMFGLELVVGGDTHRRTTQNQASAADPAPAKIIVRASHFDATVLADFRFLLSNRSALSAFAGIGIAQEAVRGTYEQAPGASVKITDSFTDVQFALGLRGEVFLYKFFSVHGRVGVIIDPFGDKEASYDGTPNAPSEVPQPDLVEDGGVDISFFDAGHLLGAFGFTVWFN